MLVGFEFGGTWEDPRFFFRICSKKSFKTRPNSPYGGETSSYSLLQQGVGDFLTLHYVVTYVALKNAMHYCI